MATLLSDLGSRTQDDRIRNDVRRQITWQSDIQSEEIGVDVKDGAVILDGRVETRLEKLEAENAAKAAFGVSSVTNSIQVVPTRARSDGEIERDVIAGLRAALCVLESAPVVTVQDGAVLLEGNVRWNFQRAGAERAADAVIGVRSVRNRIQVGALPSILPVPETPRPRPMLLLGRGKSLSLVGDRSSLGIAS